MKLFAAQTANGDSAIENVASMYRNGYRIVKVNITGTATVKLYGRMDPNDSVWAELASFTASGADAVVLTPQVKMTISGAAGASVDAWVDAQSA